LIAGIDYSTRAIDIVLLDEDSDAATWHRFELAWPDFSDAFARARSVPVNVPGPRAEFWDDVLAVGIEDPRGYNAGALFRIQGALLTRIPRDKLVHPLIPSQWRKTVGLPGNASKVDVAAFALGRREPMYDENGRGRYGVIWPQDACDAYCIALATRTLLERVPA
jgi:hypothetical protein